MEMIVIFTAVHGAYEVAKNCFNAIDSVVAVPFLHYIGDDFSPGDDSDWYMAEQGFIRRDGNLIGERIYYHCKELGATESPNLGLSMGHAFDVARLYGAEALLLVESDVVVQPGLVDAFREAHNAHGPTTGAVAPLYTEVGGDTITTYGGMGGNIPQKLGIDLGTKIGSWDQTEIRTDILEWTHTACLWIPKSTLDRPEIQPDPDFGLYYCDHDLSYQIMQAGLDVIVTDRAVAGHSRNAASTGIKWPKQIDRDMAELSAKQQLYTKWDI